MTEHGVLNFSVRSVSKLTNTLMSTLVFQGFPLLRCLTQINCIRQLTKHNQKAHRTKVPMQESCRARIQTLFLSTILRHKKGTNIHTEYTVENLKTRSSCGWWGEGIDGFIIIFETVRIISNTVQGLK